MRSRFSIHRAALFWIVLAATGLAPAVRAERVAIVAGQQASPLEKKAAQSLLDRMKRLFPKCDIRIHGTVPSEAEVLLLVGNPDSNQAIRRLSQGAAGFSWPKMSNQGHCLRSVKLGERPALVVGGGSPVATLWAVHELEHRWGVRVLITGDVEPAPGELPSFADIDVVLEPSFPIRSMRLLGDTPWSTASWSLNDHQRLLAQLAKLKFNRVTIDVRSFQPFVDFEFKGTKKQGDSLWKGRYPIESETVGRDIFGSVIEFDNRDFQGKTAFADRIAEGKKLLRGIVMASKEFGIHATLSLDPLDVPHEFVNHLPDPRFPAEGANVSPSDPSLSELTSRQIEAYLETYADLNGLSLKIADVPAWRSREAEAARDLTKEFSLSPGLEKLLTAKDAASKDGSAIDSIPLGSLEFVTRLLREEPLMRRLPAGVNHLHPYLLPWAGKLFPIGTECTTYVVHDGRFMTDYLDRLKAGTNDANHLSLAIPFDVLPAVGMPQFQGNMFSELVETLRLLRWQGFETSSWLSNDQDACVYYLSRAAFEDALSPRDAIKQLYGPIGGEPAAERMLLSYSKLEAASKLMDPREFTLDSPDDWMKHFTAGTAPPDAWKEVAKHYGDAMNEMYRANDAFTPKQRPVVYFFAKRLEYALELVGSMTALREAGVAWRAKDKELASEKLATAVEAMYNGLTAYALIAKTASDRGAIAVLNEWAYKPMVEQLAKIDESSE